MIQCPYDTHSRCDSAGCPGRLDVAFCRARSDPEKYPVPEPRENWVQAPVKPPGFLAMVGNVVKATATHAANALRKASPEVQAERAAQCKACPHFDEAAQQCRICGCTNMRLKWSWASSACPDDPPRWEAVS